LVDKREEGELECKMRGYQPMDMQGGNYCICGLLFCHNELLDSVRCPYLNKELLFGSGYENYHACCKPGW